MRHRYRIIPVFIPHASCPNQCLFCNQKKITGVSAFDFISVKETIEKCIGSSRAGEPFNEIAFYGGSFTAISQDEQEALLGIAKFYIDKGAVKSIRVSTRPDCINEDALSRLKRYGAKTIELGVQSMSDAVLLANKRGHTRRDTEEASKMIRTAGFTLGHQIMFGLYKDTRSAMLETIEESLMLKPDFLRVYPCLVIKGTELARLYSEGEYEPLSLKEAIEICKIAYLRATDKNVKIIRMGIHPDNDFVESGFIAGPFHPAFKFLVMSSLFLDLSELLIKNNDLNGDITVYLNERDTANFIGDKRENINRIKEKYPISNVSIINSKDVAEGSISIKYKDLYYNANILDVPLKKICATSKEALFSSLWA